MGSKKKVRPSPRPSEPALVRPTLGAVLLSLGAATGCAHSKPLPPMPPPPMPDPGIDSPLDEAPMDEAPMDDPAGDPPMVEPTDEVPPMPDPG